MKVFALWSTFPGSFTSASTSFARFFSTLYISISHLSDLLVTEMIFVSLWSYLSSAADQSWCRRFLVAWENIIHLQVHRLNLLFKLLQPLAKANRTCQCLTRPLGYHSMDVLTHLIPFCLCCTHFKGTCLCVIFWAFPWKNVDNMQPTSKILSKKQVGPHICTHPVLPLQSGKESAWSRICGRSTLFPWRVGLSRAIGTAYSQPFAFAS